MIMSRSKLVFMEADDMDAGKVTSVTGTQISSNKVPP